MSQPSYTIREYALQQGALEIAYIEEFFNDFPKRKTASDILTRLDGRESAIFESGHHGRHIRSIVISAKRHEPAILHLRE